MASCHYRKQDGNNRSHPFRVFCDQSNNQIGKKKEKKSEKETMKIDKRSDDEHDALLMVSAVGLSHLDLWQQRHRTCVSDLPGS
jgi:hypothetical protein